MLASTISAFPLRAWHQAGITNGETEWTHIHDDELPAISGFEDGRGEFVITKYTCLEAVECPPESVKGCLEDLAEQKNEEFREKYLSFLKTINFVESKGYNPAPGSNVCTDIDPLEKQYEENEPVTYDSYDH